MVKWLKKILFIFILLFPTVIIAENLETYSRHILVYNLDDNEIIFERNTNDKIYIASLTKIMTALVSIENIENINEKIVFPKVNISYDFTTVGFKNGESLTYADLLYSALLPSAADATDGLAKLISGSTDEFVKLMNKKAEELGMKNTHYSNTYGDNPNNYSTINDLLILMKYALKNKTFYKIFTTKEYVLSNGQKIETSVYYYTRGLNIDTSKIVGAKTGFTSKAGYCMISIYKEKSIPYLIITTDADYKTYQVLDGVGIGKYFDENYEYKSLLEKDELLTKVKGFGIKIPIYSDEEIKKFIDKEVVIKNEYKGSNKITYSSSVNDKIGEYIIWYGDDNIVKDVRIPNNFKAKFLLFVYKVLYIDFQIKKYLLFIFNII